MKDWRVRLGLVLGAALTALHLIVASLESPASGHGRLLTDCEGRLDEIVIHYVPDAAGIVGNAYRDFLGALPAEVTVRVVIPDATAFEDLKRRVGAVRCRLSPVVAGHAMTTWSRDRWLALDSAGDPPRVLLLSPRLEAAAGVWPERDGDSRIGHDLARLLDHVVAHRSGLVFDGGDFVADDETVFVTPAVLRRNRGVRVRDTDGLVRILERRLGRRVVLLSDAPPHHAGMFMMPVGDRTMLVGDPSLARPLHPPATSPLAAPDFSEETQSRFDAVATTCRHHGYRVVRIPVVPGRDGRSYLSYVNVILEVRDGERHVYMPVYAGADGLNRSATAVWKQLGFRVHAVDCTRTFSHAGSLRCLVNVLARA